jgi:predicted dehydrogenase
MKVLFVGLGGIGQRHLRNLRKLMGYDIDIMAYRIRKNTQVLTDQLSVEEGSDLEEKYRFRTIEDLDQALDQNPDVVFICNPSSMHMPVALAAAQAGCHLFIEKPISHSYDQVEKLIDRVESQDLVAFVGYQMRFHPCLLRLHSLLQQKLIGRVIAVRIEMGEYLPGWHKYEDYRLMYAARHELGGGVILSQIHEFDYIYWLFGLPTRIFTIGGHLSRLEIDVEDVASTLMEYRIEDQRVPIHVHQDYVQLPPSRNCQIIGDSGKIFVDFRNLSVKVFDQQGNLTEANSYPDFERNQLFTDEMGHFIKCLEGKEKPLVSIRDGAQSLRMALAAKESMDTGRIVELPRM